MAVLAAIILLVCTLEAAESPVPAFGVISDIQYGDKDLSGPRHYRESLLALSGAVSNLNSKSLGFVIELGDIVDGYGKDSARTLTDLDRVLSVFNTLTAPKYFVIGNHCMNAGIKNLKQRLGLSVFYYDFTSAVCPGWRFVVLDGNDAGYGVISVLQLEWLSGVLAHSTELHERVIVFCHFPLLKEAASAHRMKTPGPVLDCLERSGCVAAYFAGHDHTGGYCVSNGIHHVTLKGLVENTGSGAYAVIRLFPDRIEETGFGSEPSRTLPFPAVPKR